MSCVETETVPLQEMKKVKTELVTSASLINFDIEADVPTIQDIDELQMKT
jgi:hypothetical protein